MEEKLFLRIHINDTGHFDAVYRLKERNGILEEGISSNRSQRSTPEITRLWEHVNSRLDGKDFGVLSIKIIDVEKVEWNYKKVLEVRFDPIIDEQIRNKAHTLIIGIPPSNIKAEKPKLLSLRKKLKSVTSWEIRYEDPIIQSDFDDSIRN